jgi:SOS-response transcriptional repressor LexA
MTPKQLKVLEAIESYWETQHCGPSLEAIAEMVGVSSRSTVHAIVKKLEEDGWITMQPKRWRTMMSARNSPLQNLPPTSPTAPVVEKKISEPVQTRTLDEQKEAGLGSLIEEPEKDELEELFGKHLTNMRR